MAAPEVADTACAPAAAVRGALGQAARPAAGAPVSEPVHGRRAAAEPVKPASPEEVQNFLNSGPEAPRAEVQTFFLFQKL